MAKRKLDQLETDTTLEDSSSSDEPSTSSLDTPERPAKVSRQEEVTGQKRVRFKGVTVFYFPRSQGFTCIPSNGGTTLGMSQRHHTTRYLSFAEYETERRRHRVCAQTLNNADTEEDSDTSDEEEDNGYEEENGEEDTDTADEDGLLQPLGIKHRRAILRASGVQVEREERLECHKIRISRQTCGCSCAGACKPDTCECALLQIKCQVDRPSFPCDCTRESCENPSGRVEFNPLRVRTHYLNTMIRSRIESQSGAPQTVSNHIRFEPDTNTYCDNATPCAQTASSGAQIPGLHTLFYPFRYGWNNESKPNPSYWQLDASSSSCYSYGYQSSYVSGQGQWGSQPQPLETSLDSGFGEGSPVEAPCYPLSSLYAHQKRLPSDSAGECCSEWSGVVGQS